MENSNHLINQSVQELHASSTTSTTEAGQTERQAQLADAINQVFALFRINYHNQYHAAFGDTEIVNQAKRLWLSALHLFSPEQILAGAKAVIEESEYLPSLNLMIRACEEHGSHGGLPSPREAYLEACHASSPKAEFTWSHPAVYHAGRLTGWHLLSSASEAQSFPEFRKHYREQLRLVIAGAELTVEPTAKVEQQQHAILSKEENLKHLDALKSTLK